MSRRRRRNPEESYIVMFGLAACAVIGIAYVAKRLAPRPDPLPLGGGLYQ